MEQTLKPVKHTLSGLLGLAWPIIISRSTQVVVGLSDALLVAHLGEASLAAVTAGSLNAVAAFIFPMGIAFIISSFSSQFMGRKDLVSARRYGWYGMILAVLSQAVMLALLPMLPWVVSKLDYSPEVAGLMVAFLSIRLMSTGVVVGMEALGNYYGGLGRTAMLMKANISAMVLNVGLNWLLINGHWGFPAMGVEGSAWASVLATTAGFLGFFVVFLWEGRKLKAAKLKLAEFTRMLRFGLPSGLNWSFEFFAFIAFINIVVAGLGTSSLAAMMAVMQINSMSFMPAFGLGSAGAILVGQSIGARKKKEVPSIVKLTFYTAATWMGLVSLAYFIVPTQLLSFFVAPGTDGVFMQVGVRMLIMSAFWQLFDAAGITLTEALRAAGDTAYAMWARAILAWGVFLPGSLLTVKVFGGTERGALAWLLIYLAGLSVVLFFRFKSGAWKKIKLVEHELPV